ncbi:MAG: ABC transporter permease subunit [Firmicutes bacterium]|nr:ABC transporter permease subunit [Bacillota bacterium]
MSAKILKGDKDTSLGKSLQRDTALYIMLLLPLTIAIIFRYVPIAYLGIAFEDYNFVDGLFGSEWVGLKWFQKFFGYRNFGLLLTNTLKISFSSLIFGFPCPIIFALMLNEVTSNRFKKAIQTASYLPYFVSTVIVIGMMNQILSPTTGVVNDVIKALGGQAINFNTEPKYFLPMYVVSGIWSSLGYSSILYLSALSGISQELYEAAEVDGAGRWRKMWHITLPGIMPTILILLLMNLGSLLSVGFEKALLMQNDLNLSASEIIGTYVYKQGIGRMEYSYSAAVDLFQGVLNLTLVTIFNTISKKAADISLW